MYKYVAIEKFASYIAAASEAQTHANGGTIVKRPNDAGLHAPARDMLRAKSYAWLALSMEWCHD